MLRATLVHGIFDTVSFDMGAFGVVFFVLASFFKIHEPCKNS